MAAVVRTVLLALMLLVIGPPLLLTLFVQRDPLGHAWLASPPLGNVVFPLQPEWTPAGWMSGDYQRRTDRWFANVVEPRGYAIPVTNQIFYAVFAKSHMYDRTIVIGRQGELYERSYVSAYCEGDTVDGGHALAALAGNVGELHERLAAGGKILLVLVTPNKAAVISERLPAGTCPPPADPAARRRRFVSLLRATGTPVIDGHALVMAMKAEDPLPPFPRGGTHWSRIVGARVADVVMREASRAGDVGVGGIHVRSVRWDSRPEKSDRDLADLLKLYAPPYDYRVGAAELVCRPTATGRSRSLLTVGGSFLYQILDPISDCGLFRQVENYFYYDTLYQRWPGPHRERLDRTKLRWRDKLAETDVVVLEIAEHLIGRAPHFERFVADALAALR
jgi:alginate O-acetyltransferase complex protein AlgJ